MGDNEEYLAGFSSPHLVRGMLRGYELHATNLRLFGLKNRKAGGGWLLGVGAGGLLGGKAAERITREQSAKTIQELERNKDFSVSKDEISHIEIKKPGTLTRGHMIVYLKSGPKFEVKLADKRVYEPTMQLIQSFYPEALREIP